MAVLQTHQERVVDAPFGKVIWHSLGSGKTLAGLKRAERMVELTKRPAVFIVPAPLVANIYKECEKHDIKIPKGMLNVYSYNEASTKKDYISSLKPCIVVVDEAHRLRNKGKMAKDILENMSLATDALPLTGTPMYNNHTDLITLINAVAGKKVLPATGVEFDAKYLNRIKVEPSLWQRTFGDVQAGERYELKKDTDLGSILNKYMDRHQADASNFPAKEEQVVKVPLSRGQIELYHALMGKLPKSIRVKIEQGLPPNKTELGRLNAFMTGPRMVSTSTNSFVVDKSKAESTKIDLSAKILAEERAKDPNFKAVVYSNFIESGIDPAVEALRRQGMKVGVFTGETSRKEKAELVKAMNSGDMDVLALSSSGAEGIDLKGVKHMHILDPHFNDNKIRQVIGRGVRYKSHEHLPEDERVVHVRRFISTMPDQSYLGGAITRKGETTADEYLYNLAQEKMKIQDGITALVKSAEGRDITIEPQYENAAETALRWARNSAIATAIPAGAVYGGGAMIANELGGAGLRRRQLAVLALKPTLATMGGMAVVGGTLGLVRSILGPRVEKNSKVVIE